MSNNRFIVTGGAGFIGCNIALELNRRGFDDIIIADDADHKDKKRNLDAVKFSELIGIKEFRSLFSPDKPACRPAVAGRNIAGRLDSVSTVFHLGACSSTTESNEEYITDNNYLYTRQLCEWCLRHNVRFIYASSAATYGDGSQGYSDDDAVTPKLKPLNLYGQSKQKFDLWAMGKGVLNRIAGIKYFNVYGAHEDHKGDMRSVANKSYKQVLDKGELRLFKSYRPEYKDGEQDRDFVYVKDAVKVTMFFHDHPEVSGIFNCGTGEARTWNDLAKAVFKAMGKKPKIVFIDMPEDIKKMYQYHTEADISKLRRVGYKESFYSLEAGVKEYVQEYLMKG